jgi:aminomethyltransferase
VGKRTPFYECHKKANAKIVDFAGWEMPLHYGSQLNEHHQVRNHAGIFDVSHMGILDLSGAGTTSYLRRLLANNIDRIVDGKALYTCMLNEDGGVIDDCIVYKISDDFYRIIVNAGTRDKDIQWMKKQAEQYLDKVSFNERKDLVMLALQGPQTKDKLAKWLTAEQMEVLSNLRPFTFTQINDLFIARTGYTGEDGYEIIFPGEKADNVWEMLTRASFAPCGLGARDTLRLEAGLNLYGADMDETVTPFESNLAWTVPLDPPDRAFIGRSALEKQVKEGVKRRLVGLILEGPGIIRNHQKVLTATSGEGEVTSGGYSPTLEKSIALARVPSEIGPHCFVEIRGSKQVPAQVVKPPFVKRK